jgi:glutamyl-tRNA(Gln) amidotransferase subunit D
MSEFRGYEKRSLAFLKDNKIKVGDFIKIKSDLTYDGILMPRYEYDKGWGFYKNQIRFDL